jgi:RNA 2',3'-cyclic 3'-phosphodiesterase
MPTIEESSAIRKQTARVFFSIWPDHKTQKQLGGLIEQLKLEALCGGRKTKSQDIHLTLVFLGEVDTHRLTALHQVADEIRDSGARAFDFSIEEIGCWKHNHIVYLASREVPAELSNLVSRLKKGVSAAGFSVERRPYAPHITLMRNALCRSLPKLPEPITWWAREWLLVKSQQTSGGSAYAPVGRWSLE